MRLPCFTLLVMVLLMFRTAGKTPIILFISDDLGVYPLEDRQTPDGTPYSRAVTPHLDAFRAEATSLDAWSNFPWCAASRACLFSGLRPRYTGIYRSHTSEGGMFPKEVLPDRPYLPKVLSENGYWTAGVGKVLHGGNQEYNVPGWSRFAYEFRSAYDYSKRVFTGGSGLDVYPDDYKLRDDRAADGAIQLIDSYLRNHHEKGLFLAVGFWKPHLPYSCHESDYYANAEPEEWEFGEIPENYPPAPCGAETTS